MNKKILITSLLLSCASIKISCMDPNYMPMLMNASSAPKAYQKTSPDLGRINTQIEQIDRELSDLNKNKSEQAMVANSGKRRDLQSKRAELASQKQKLEKSIK